MSTPTPAPRENKAVRAFLMHYGGQGLSVGQMKKNLRTSGWNGCWPAWCDEPGEDKQHLTKGGAQDWLRHLFALESSPAPGEAEPVARILHWHGPTHWPVPHGGICARTFAEFPRGEGEKPKGYWHEGAPLYTSPAPRQAAVTDAMVEAGARLLCENADTPGNLEWARRWARKVLEAAALASPPPPLPQADADDLRTCLRATVMQVEGMRYARNLFALCETGEQVDQQLATLEGRIATHESAIADVRRELKASPAALQPQADTEKHLRNLLARIHRDGGHYADEHGLQKASADADAKVVQWLGDEALLRQAVEALTLAQNNLAGNRGSAIDSGDGAVWDLYAAALAALSARLAGEKPDAAMNKESP